MITLANKINFHIEVEKTGTGVMKTGNLVPRDYTQYEDLLSKADRFDSTNVRGRLRLNDTNFYNYRQYYKNKKAAMDENQDYTSEDSLSFAYAHQIQTVETILKLPSGGLLADQVGMGKTIEAGMLISELAYRDEWRVLVITLSNDELINNWKNEMYDKFGLTLAILGEKNKASVKEVFNTLCKYQQTGIATDINGKEFETINGTKRYYKGVLIPFSYLVDDNFIQLVDKFNEDNPKQPFHVDMIVVDESHRYTSSDSARSDNKIKALHHLQMKQKRIVDGVEYEQKLGRILLLTATPIKNDLNELLELMQIINPSKTEEDFRKDLGLTEEDEFDLTTVLQKHRGVNKWWEWFSQFGERHTRITTLYDPVKRRFGVHWKTKNSHSFYFNNDNLIQTRDYFIDDDSETKIKLVSGSYIERENFTSPLKGVRDSAIVNYRDTIEEIDMDKFNRFMEIVRYIKKEISLEALEKVGFNEKIDGFSYKSLVDDYLVNCLKKKGDLYTKWKAIKHSYSEMGNEPEEIEAKKVMESYVASFLVYSGFSEFGDNNAFIDSIFKFIIKRIPKQQIDKNGIEVVKSYQNLALILCSGNFFLQLEKMLKLGTIINSDKHSNEKIIIFCKDDSERRMLVENHHLWDFNNRYMDNDSVAKIGNISENSINHAKFLNVVSIAYTTDAEGLNLQSYHTMINYSIVLSPLHMEQRIGRIDRIGQRNEMDVYFFANCQDVEGYILRFFEYELELFSNWSGDTTASTYYDGRDYNGNSVKVEFDKAATQNWEDIMKNSMDYQSKIESFETEIAKVFNNVRARVIKIAQYSKDIEDMKQNIDTIAQDDFDMYF